MSERKPSLGAVFLTICLDLLGFGLALPFLADMARTTFHVSSLVGTLVASSYSAMQFLFVPVWGRLSDRVGRKPVLAWSVAATAIGNLGLGLALALAPGTPVGVVWVFAARMFSGIATANLGTASAYIADITPPRERARGMALIGMAFGIGFILGPGLGGLLAQVPFAGRHGPWALFVASMLSVVNFVWVLLGVVESLPPSSRAAAKPTGRRSPIDFAATLEVMRSGTIARAVLANFVVITCFSGMEQTMRFYNADAFSMSLAQTGVLLLLVGVTAAAVQGGIVRRLSGRVEDASMLRAGVGIQALAFAGIALSPSVGKVLLYASSMVLAVGNGLNQPASSAYVSKQARATEQGATLGVSQSMASLARVLGPALGGWVYGSALGIRSPYVVGCIGMLVALTIALPLRDPPQREDRKPGSQED